MIQLAIIDDHQILIDGLRKILKQHHGFNILLEATDGTEVLNSKRLSEIDVFIIDIEMPHIDGITLSKSILKLHPKAKIVILSMYNDSLLLEKLKEFGISGFLNKNANETELIDTLRKINSGAKIFKELLIKNTIKYKELLPEFSKRELEVLSLIIEGYTNNQIGEKLFLSPKTVDNHRTNIMKKMKVNNVASMVRVALKGGFFI